jgi:hypothetical protein
MKQIILIAIGLLLVGGEVKAAEKVFFCTDQNAGGLKWAKNGAVKVAKFVKDRFTLKVLSAKKRQVKFATSTRTLEFNCRLTPIHTVSCIDAGVGAKLFYFNGLNYTYASIYGTPVGGDPNIVVSHGTCTKF